MIATALLKVGGTVYYPGSEIGKGVDKAIMKKLTDFGLLRKSTKANKSFIGNIFGNRPLETAEKKTPNKETRTEGDFNVDPE